ncbi:hypothetical protein [Agromyces humatus]|uniref:Siderophore-interacting protein n=1 Tax=Agromyces humatus TaxID=279573 RepID=A0ABN2KPA6_9MICO|nr:hypothetical protein [Agromyces humatus]
MPPDDLAARLLAALEHGDELALAGVLHRDVRLVVDAGDEAGREARGRVRVIRVLRAHFAMHPDASPRTVHVNGRPGLALRSLSGEVVAVLGVDGGATIEALWLSAAPMKLARWNPRRNLGPDVE